MRRKNTPIIDMQNVVKTFSTPAGDFTVLKGISLKVMQGEFVGIVGPSGSGKSTLLNMITGIDRPTSGKVFVQGKRVDTMSENEMARWRGRNIGIIFQFFQLLPTLSALENVMLPMDFCNIGRGRERKERAIHCLELVGLAKHANKLPGSLSGGEQQRVAIARALANDPPILLADEPTGNLDSKTGDEIFSLFERLVANGKTILMVTHNRDLAARIPRMVGLLDGRIIFRGDETKEEGS
jgi:putative ABC transport system ATP-binding protein